MSIQKKTISCFHIVLTRLLYWNPIAIGHLVILSYTCYIKDFTNVLDKTQTFANEINISTQLLNFGFQIF